MMTCCASEGLHYLVLLNGKASAVAKNTHFDNDCWFCWLMLKEAIDLMPPIDYIELASCRARSGD